MSLFLEFLKHCQITIQKNCINLHSSSQSMNIHHTIAIIMKNFANPIGETGRIVNCLICISLTAGVFLFFNLLLLPLTDGCGPEL